MWWQHLYSSSVKLYQYGFGHSHSRLITVHNYKGAYTHMPVSTNTLPSQKKKKVTEVYLGFIQVTGHFKLLLQCFNQPWVVRRIQLTLKANNEPYLELKCNSKLNSLLVWNMSDISKMLRDNSLKYATSDLRRLTLHHYKIHFSDIMFFF